MSLTKKEQAVRDARRVLQDAEAELAIAKRMRAAEPRPGAKVLITAVFPRSSKVYTYLALRPEGTEATRTCWYVTGQEGPVSWDSIIARVERADYQVRELYFR